MKYVTPSMQSFSKEDIRNNIVASATTTACTEVYCSAGTSFTCGVEVDYIKRKPDEII